MSTHPGSAYSLDKPDQTIETHTMTVLVDNEPGVLARVIGLFSGRGYNIDSLTVSETEHEAHLSRITIVTSGPPMVIEQIQHQLEKLVPIHSVTDLTVVGNPLERELAMVKVAGKGEKHAKAQAIAEEFHAADARTLRRRISSSRSPASGRRSSSSLPSCSRSAWSRSPAPASPPSAAGPSGCKPSGDGTCNIRCRAAQTRPSTNEADQRVGDSWICAFITIGMPISI